MRIIRNGNPLLLHQAAVATEAAFSIYGSRHTPAGKRFKIHSRGNCQIPGFFQNRFCKGMLGFLLQCRCYGQKLLFIRGRQDVRNNGLARGQRAGLIQHHRIDPVQLLQRCCVLEQNAQLCRPTGAYHNGHRGGKAQSAGAGDHQHRNGGGQCKGKILADQQPNNQHHQGDGHDHRNKDPGDPVCQPGNGRFRAAGLLHKTDDLRKGGILPHFIRRKFDIARRQGSRGGNTVTGRYIHRDALSGQCALVDGAVAGSDHTVHRDIAAGANNNGIPHTDFLHRDLDLHAVSDDGSSFRSEIHQLLDGIAGFSFGPGLQEFTKGHKG